MMLMIRFNAIYNINLWCLVVFIACSAQILVDGKHCYLIPHKNNRKNIGCCNSLHVGEYCYYPSKR